MLSRQHLNLILAATLVASMLMVLGATYDPGEVSAALKPRAKILRRYDKLPLKPTSQEADLLRSQTYAKGERQFENSIPKYVPVKIKFKAGKEEKFKDLSNAEWVRDLELEVTNTSDKPIYLLEFWLMLPDIKSENDNQIAFSLRYGRIDFIHFNTRPIATDVPIQPGETITLSIGPEWQQGWREFKARRNAADPKMVKLKFVDLSFGDGTGFTGGGAEPYPYKREQSSTGSCREGPPESPAKPALISTRIQFPAFSGQSSFPAPAAILPVNFFLANTFYRQPELQPQPDLNCPGTDCVFAKAQTYQCSCTSLAKTFQIVSSGDPEGNCQLTERAEFFVLRLRSLLHPMVTCSVRFSIANANPDAMSGWGLRRSKCNTCRLHLLQSTAERRMPSRLRACGKLLLRQTMCVAYAVTFTMRWDGPLDARANLPVDLHSLPTDRWHGGRRGP